MVDQPASIGALPLAVARDMGCPVAYLPGLTMRRIADLYPGEAKTDARDAFIIADAARAMPHTLRTIDGEDETIAELEMIVGFDDDLAGEATRAANRLHGLLTQIHPSLERVLGPRLQHPAVLTLLERFGSPAQIRKAGRRRLVTLLRPKAPRMAERLVEEIFAALDEQTVTVPGTEAAALIVPSLATSLTAVLDQRKLLAGRIEELLEAHPLSKVLTSMPGVGVRTGARILIEVGDGSTFPTADHLAAYAGLGPGDPELGLIDPRRTALQTGKQAAQTGLLPLRVRSPGRPGLAGLLRQEDRPGQTPHPGRSASPDAEPTSSSRCSETAPSTNRSRRPPSPELRVCEEDDPIGLNVEAEHRMAVLALRVHQHRLAQPTPDLPKEAAEHIKPVLALQLPQVDVEVDFVVGMEAEDRQHIVRRPDPQVRALGIRRTGQHGLRTGHRKHRLPLRVLALPALLRDKVEDRLPILHRGIRDTHVRQRPHQVQVEEALHVIPQQVAHPAMLPGSPTQRTPVSLDQGHRGTPRPPGGRRPVDRGLGLAASAMKERAADHGLRDKRVEARRLVLLWWRHGFPLLRLSPGTADAAVSAARRPFACPGKAICATALMPACPPPAPLLWHSCR